MLRPDYGLNEDVFLKYFSEYKISSICSDKLIQPQGLQKIANNLQDFFLFIDDIDEDIPENYFRFVKRLGVNLNILSKKEEHVSALRNKYFDIPVRYAYPAREKPCEITEKTRFISRKRIVCEGKEYLSYAHFKKGLDRNNKVLDSPEYWRELDHFYIYESE
jgi:hypothetical protein